MNDCIFCKLANGEIPTNTVFEDENFRVILDAAPANLGHCLVLPKSHAKDIFEMPQELTEKAFGVAKKIAEAIKKSGLAENVNILQNNGELAGQTVSHFHVHVIPRLENDDVVIKSKAVDVDDEKTTNVIKSIKSAL